MFYLFLIFHVFMFIESYILFKKKQRRKSLYIFLINLVLVIFNINLMLPTISSEIGYSSVVYGLMMLKENPFPSLFWILLNLFGIGAILYIMNLASKKKKQNEVLKLIGYILSGIITFYFITILFNKIMAFILLLTTIFILIYLIKIFYQKQQNYVLASIILILVFAVYSFGFYTGAARLQIALLGYPTEAYNTGLEELKFYKEKNIKKYSPIQKIPTAENDMELIQVKSYLGIKIGTYYS